MSQASDNETKDQNLTEGRMWAAYNTDGDDTDSSMDAPRTQRCYSQQSSVSFKSDWSDSEQSDFTSRRRPKSFQVILVTSVGKFAVGIKASGIKMFIKQVQENFHSKCQKKKISRKIDSLSLEVSKDNYVSLDEDSVDFSFLKPSKQITVKIESSLISPLPIIHNTVSVGHTEVRNSGKQQLTE